MFLIINHVLISREKLLKQLRAELFNEHAETISNMKKKKQKTKSFSSDAMNTNRILFIFHKKKNIDHIQNESESTGYQRIVLKIAYRPLR